MQANGKRAVNFDLFLNIVDTGNGLRLECDYSTGLYDEATIARWMQSYRTLLEAIVANPAQSVATLEILEPSLRTFLLEGVQSTGNRTDGSGECSRLNCEGVCCDTGSAGCGLLWSGTDARTTRQAKRSAGVLVDSQWSRPGFAGGHLYGSVAGDADCDARSDEGGRRVCSAGSNVSAGADCANPGRNKCACDGYISPTSGGIATIATQSDCAG